MVAEIYKYRYLAFFNVWHKVRDGFKKRFKSRSRTAYMRIRLYERERKIRGKVQNCKYKKV